MTIYKTAHAGVYVLALWKIECKCRNNVAKTTIFVRAAKSTSPKPNSGASIIVLWSTLLEIVLCI